MDLIAAIDTSRFGIAISRDLRMSPVNNVPGQHGVEGLLVSFADLRRNPPHGGEQHPDGDELIYIVSGAVVVTTDAPGQVPCLLSAGQACIVPKGEWHRVSLKENTRLIAITAGPSSNYRSRSRSRTDAIGRGPE